MKTCSVCKELKPFDAFGGYKIKKDGLRPQCKSCVAAYVRRKRAECPEIFRQRERAKCERDPESRRRLNREAAKRFAEKHPVKKREAIKASVAARRSKDPTYRMIGAARSRIAKILRGIRGGKLLSLLEYTHSDLVEHLERQFSEGMTWKNYGQFGSVWHVDHIRPVASFDPADYETLEDMVRDIFALSNLRPLWASENQLKSSDWNGRRVRRRSTG